MFSPASAALLGRVATDPVELAYDLGCGIGDTTRLVAESTGAVTTIGLDVSDAHLGRAGAQDSPDLRFARHDVTEVPFPAGPADVIFARLVLAHLPDPAAQALAWSTQLRPGGVLVLDEIEWIRSDEPALVDHLELVTALVATTGARMCAGPLLWRLGDNRELAPELAEVVEVPVHTGIAAQMFSASLASLGDRAVALGLCRGDHRDQLARRLADLSASPTRGQITWGLHQAAYRRLAVSPRARR